MGLSANQARVLLLTSKNDAYELQAQLISNERLALAQEQERISNEYSDATSNEIYTCSVRDPSKAEGKGTSEKILNFESLSQANEGQIVYIEYGDKKYGAKSTYDDATGKWETKYYDADGKEIAADDTIKALNEQTSYGGALQVMARNNTIKIYIPADEDTNTADNANVRIGGKPYVQKTPSSLATVSSRYYTEDDAAAEAAYNTAMAKVNAIDKKLENKLNQIETQKKAVETELESAKNLVKTNEERTFKYMS